MEDYHEKHDALSQFEALYLDKTGNRWSQRNSFEKKAGKFFPMDLDLGQDSQDIAKLESKGSKSKLDKPIQELITLIFDIESMKKAMVEFEVSIKIFINSSSFPLNANRPPQKSKKG